MIYMAPISGKNEDDSAARLMWVVKADPEAVSLEVTSKSSRVTCSRQHRVVRCSKFLAGRKHGRLVNRIN